MQTDGALTLDQIDLSDLAFWTLPMEIRHAAFTTLRAERPIAFFEEPDYQGLLPPGRGYYALTRYHDIVEVSRQPQLFCSRHSSTTINDLPHEFLEFFGSMMQLDDPQHQRLRGIVSKAFAARRVREIEDIIDRVAADVVSGIDGTDEFDFVTGVAARMPLKVICDMMGIPESHYEFVFDQGNLIIGAADPEYIQEPEKILETSMGAARALSDLMYELAADRRANPAGDLLSALIHAEVDGEKLTHQELASFFILLTVAGNETTRNAISWGMLTLSQHPKQREIWQSDFDGLARPAVEEILRWASPVIFMRRTVTTDGARVAETEFREGDKLIMYYPSANRDEAVFDDPFTFDVRREPNPQMAFGGSGPHFCLGANLARMEIKAMFRELFTQTPHLEVTGEPHRLISSFINGIKHMPVRTATKLSTIQT